MCPYIVKNIIVETFITNRTPPINYLFRRVDFECISLWKSPFY